MISEIAAERDDPAVLGLEQRATVPPVRSVANNDERTFAPKVSLLATVKPRGVAEADLDPLLQGTRIAEPFKPGRARRAAPGRVDHEIGEQDLLDTSIEPDANALDGRTVGRGNQALHGAVLNCVYIGKSQKPAADMAFQNGTRGEQANHVARHGFQRHAATNPDRITANIAAEAAGGDDFTGPAGKEPLDQIAATRKQAMDVATLRDPFARDIGRRKGVPLENRDICEKFRQRASGEQAAHAGADYDGMLSNLLHKVLLPIGPPNRRMVVLEGDGNRFLRRFGAAITTSSAAV